MIERDLFQNLSTNDKVGVETLLKIIFYLNYKHHVKFPDPLLFLGVCMIMKIEDLT